MRTTLLALLLLGCPKAPTSPTEPAPSPEPAPADAPLASTAIRTGDDLVMELHGRRVTAFGRLVQATSPDGREGVALRLADAALLWVGFGDPPHGWDWLLDMDVRVQGTLLLDDGSHPILDEPDAPLPADGDMLLR